MYCIDQPDDFFLLGNENNAEFQYFEVIMVPCNYLHTEFGHTEDTISPECIGDLQKQLEYLGPLNIAVYHT